MEVQLVLGVICGVICALVASSKGRNGIGWFFAGFFINVIGLIIVLCVSNLKEEQARTLCIEQDNRRLREQLRQEQLKAEAFRMHTQGRLDAHDQHLGIDTRSVNSNLLDGSASVVGLLHNGNPAATVAPATSGTPGWYYSIEGQIFGPVMSSRLAQLLGMGTIPRTAIVWVEGMTDWVPVQHIPEFNAGVNS